MGINSSDEHLNALTEELEGIVRETLVEVLESTEHAETDLWTLEQATIAAMQRIGVHFLEGLVKACQPTEPAKTIPCRCGGTAAYIRSREGTIITLVDQIRISRAYYLCAECGEGTYEVHPKSCT